MINFISQLLQWQALRYIISGGSAAVTNLVTLFILVHFFHVWYLFSAVFAFLAAVLVSFLMQKFFTFEDGGREKIARQSAIYLVIQVANLGPNALLLYLAVDKLHIHYLVSQVIVLGIIALYSFFLFKYFVFAPEARYNKGL